MFVNKLVFSPEKEDLVAFWYSATHIRLFQRVDYFEHLKCRLRSLLINFYAIPCTILPPTEHITT